MKKLITTLQDTSLFRKLYIICLFLCTVSFVQIGAYVLLILLFIWGVFLFIYNAIKHNTILKTRFGLWLLLFLILTLITAIIHFNSNFFYNIIISLHVAICFFVFYSVHTEPNLNFRAELYTICRFMVYTTSIVGIIGLSCLFAGISIEVGVINFIIYENRFTSLYSNPNVLGFVSVCGIFCTHMLCKKDFIKLSEKNRVSRIWIATSLIINAVSLFLCDSNASIVLAACYCIFFLVYKFFGAERKFTVKQIVTKLLAMVLIGVFLVGAVFSVRYITQNGFSTIIKEADIISEHVNEDNGEEILAATSRITFSHINTNIDSGRITLWKQAAYMFKDFPLFGIGKGNIYDYGTEKFEDGIKFSDIYGNELSAFVTDFHNGYATLLVCSGILGFIIFAIFGVRFAKHVTIHVFKEDELTESVFPCMYSFLCAYLVYAFFEKALLFDVSFIVLFFWLIMGYTSCFLEKYEPNHNNSVYLFKKRLRKSIF